MEVSGSFIPSKILKTTLKTSFHQCLWKVFPNILRISNITVNALKCLSEKRHNGERINKYRHQETYSDQKTSISFCDICNQISFYFCILKMYIIHYLEKQSWRIIPGSNIKFTSVDNARQFEYNRKPSTNPNTIRGSNASVFCKMLSEHLSK